MDLTELLVGLAVLVGLVGIVVPVLPGSVLILGAVLVWSIDRGDATAWVVFALVAVMLVVGAVVKYAVPGRRLKATGVPQRTLVLGFVLGVYLAEVSRVGKDEAGPSTKHALKAVGLSVLIELAAGMVAALTWFVGALIT